MCVRHWAAFDCWVRGCLAGKPGRKGAGVCGGDDLMAVVSSHNKQALTIQRKGDLWTTVTVTACQNWLTGDMNKREEKRRREKKTHGAIQEETGTNFLEKNIAAVLHVWAAITQPAWFAHTVLLVSLWRLARGKVRCLCDPFKRLLA